MSRKQAVQIENNFTKGLITENTALNFPENACTEALNCVFDETGRVSRRRAIDLEDRYTPGTTQPSVNGQAYTEYLWDQIDGTGTVSFFVQQQGDSIVFYDVSTETTVSAVGEKFRFSLETYKVFTTPYSVAEQGLQYSQGNGALLIVGKAIEPLYVRYDSNNSMFTVKTIDITYRDFAGVNPVNTLYVPSYRPPFDTILDMKTDPIGDGAIHYYNLLNQGWWQGNADNAPTTSALGLWATARTDMPSNNDYVGAYRSSFTVPFDNNRVNNYSQGNSLAPKGHFILSVGKADRLKALTADGYNLAFNSTSDVAISINQGNNVGNFNSLGLAFDGSTATGGSTKDGSNDADTTQDGNGQFRVTPTVEGYVGRRYPGGVRVPYWRVYMSVFGDARDTALVNDGAPSYPGASFISGQNAASYESKSDITITYQLYGKNGTAPSTSTDGSLLGSTSRVSTLTNGGTGLREFTKATTTISSNDSNTSYEYVWLRFSCTSRIYSYGYGSEVGGTYRASLRANVYECYPFQRVTSSGQGNLPSVDTTVERPTTVEFFSSRAWYAGVDETGLSNNLYFSQIVESDTQLGRCYQTNDPTSEIRPDVLPTDGGIIRIPEMGKVIKLYNYQTSLLVFATNGVWLVRGGNGGFTATDFVVRKISSLGTQSPYSFVDVNGFPVWWGEDGIFQIEYNPQFDSFSVNSLTETTIQRLFDSVAPSERKFVKGCFDSRNKVCYWLYNTRQDYENFRYSNVLMYNTLSQSFYPWTISHSSIGVHGLLYVTDSIGSETSTVKYTCRHRPNTGNEFLLYADTERDQYIDWQTYATQISFNLSDAISYPSSFTTGYKIHGETIKFFQPNYMLVYLETTNQPSSCFMQGVFDFAINGDSGKWGTKQELYNTSLLNRSINYRRLKIRGKGRSVQFRFFSESPKPFTIIGWGGFETVNSEV